MELQLSDTRLLRLLLEAAQQRALREALGSKLKAPAEDRPPASEGLEIGLYGETFEYRREDLGVRPIYFIVHYIYMIVLMMFYVYM